MKTVVDFLKSAGTYFLATAEGDQPRVRPFGTVNIFEDKVYIQTGKVKNVSKQIHANPKVEICACVETEWLRITAELVEDDRREPRQAMLDAYPALQHMYSADDGNTEVFYLKDAVAVFSSFGTEPRVVNFG
ncbi:MAG: pyridoxamine 5'-phosphate oxidase family protein [Lachnospiraceae bacterium]|nr:pyridoxamine 5'-phosphate oxidase family protein [Lachnospiraceae bacterium]